MQSALLDQWYISNNQLHGIVYGHPSLTDGTEIATSLILSANYELKTVNTQNTTYWLKDVHSRYYQYCTNGGELMMTERLFGAQKVLLQ